MDFIQLAKKDKGKNATRYIDNTIELKIMEIHKRKLQFGIWRIAQRNVLCMT